MIRGVGVDIVQVKRIKGLFERWGEKFVGRVFAEGERMVLQGEKVAERLAARFAAKEAFLKALGKGIFQIPLKEIEVVKGERGEPRIVLKGKAAMLCEGLKVHLSLSHDGGYAIAFVVVEDETHEGPYS